jgi:hypothetical protein
MACAAVEIAVVTPQVLRQIPGIGDHLFSPQAGDEVILQTVKALTGASEEDIRGSLAETRALEHAIGLFRKHLHPLHLQVFSTVAMLHERYVTLGDLRAGAAANEHLLAYHRHVYAFLAGKELAPLVTATAETVLPHPMLSLQLYTQGDLYMALADGAMDGDMHPIPASRAALLTSLFVAYNGAADATGDFAGAKIRPATLPVAVTSVEAVKTWLRFAAASYREAYVGLRVTHGPAHSLTAQASASARHADEALVETLPRLEMKIKRAAANAAAEAAVEAATSARRAAVKPGEAPSPEKNAVRGSGGPAAAGSGENASVSSEGGGSVIDLSASLGKLSVSELATTKEAGNV